MAARKRKVTLNDDWKDKIRAGVLMARLLGHVEGDIEMSATQIKAADILLKKIVPDLARTENTGPDGGPQELKITWQSEK
jgi:hypothetical protein